MSTTLTLALSILAANLTPPPNPSAIAAGDEAAPCAWPSVVGLMRNSISMPGELTLLCSGTLVAPDLVLTAAHCVLEEDPIVSAGFGETVQPAAPPTRSVEVLGCEVHPDALPVTSINTVKHDIALCRLAEAVDDVPIIPVISACEADAVAPGASVTIVGFGSSEQVGKTSSGAGTKRSATQEIDVIDADDWHNIRMFNLDGPAACGGDSGGPAFVQLDDGSWRVIGAGSSTYSPDGAVPPVPKGNACWGGSVYSHGVLFLDWLEEVAGAPLTCHDANDRWIEGACSALQSAPGSDTAASWAEGCNDGSSIARPMACEAGGTGGGSESSGTDGDASTGDGGSSSTTADPGGEESSSTGLPAPTSDTSGEPTATASADGDADDTGDGGCSCRTTSGAGAPWMLLTLVLLRRRRAALSPPGRRSRG